MKPKCYIAGKITGLPEEDYITRFEFAKVEVRGMGFEPVSPVDLPHDHDRSYPAYLREGIKALMDCRYIYLLKNWEESDGAKLERYIALRTGIKLIRQ